MKLKQAPEPSAIIPFFLSGTKSMNIFVKKDGAIFK